MDPEYKQAPVSMILDMVDQAEAESEAAERVAQARAQDHARVLQAMGNPEGGLTPSQGEFQEAFHRRMQNPPPVRFPAFSIPFTHRKPQVP